MNLDTDILVIGSGLAGMYFALLASENHPDLEITLLTKESLMQSNSFYAQGGIAVVADANDSMEQHIIDTVHVGDGLCDPDVVRMVVEKGMECLKQLEGWGVQFDRDDQGDFLLSREGGHSANRVVHHKDVTGMAIIQALTGTLLRKENVKVIENCHAVDLIIDKSLNGKKQCVGCLVFDRVEKKEKMIFSTLCMLSTGGVGGLYQKSTNPNVATGDGIAMAKRAGVKMQELAFVQFHPTVMKGVKTGKEVLVTEALRGSGAILRNHQGEAFMVNYDPRKELASRDIVSRAIYEEMRREGKDHVLLDLRHLSLTYLKDNYPGLIKHCGENGIDPSQEMLPVFPAAHYMCGGVVVDKYARTSLSGLMACGEVARTGLHGANRLASNSLLEAIVYAHQANQAIESTLQELVYYSKEVGHNLNNFGHADQYWLEDQIANVRTWMQQSVSAVRSDIDLEDTLFKLQNLRREVGEVYDLHLLSAKLLELRNMVEASIAIVEDSIDRSENRGCFFKQAEPSKVAENLVQSLSS